MANRKFEMHEYRQVLIRMRLGDSDRAITKTGLMGRRKIGEVRGIAQTAGWLDPQTPLPVQTSSRERLGSLPEPSKPISFTEPVSPAKAVPDPASSRSFSASVRH